MDISKVFKSIDDKLWKGGVANALDYMEQSSWILFLKYLSDQEEERLFEAEIEGKTYQPIFQPQFLWSEWACKRNEDGTRDHTQDLTGEDLINFVDDELFPYLESFQSATDNNQSIEGKIAIVVAVLAIVYSKAGDMSGGLDTFFLVISRLQLHMQRLQFELEYSPAQRIRGWTPQT